MLVHCGIDDPMRINLNAENIYQDKSIAGTYDQIADAVSINIKYIKQYKAGERANKILVLRTIIHEYLHSLSYQDISYDVKKKDFVRARLGLGEISEDIDESRFVALEEGFNEILTKRVMDEYMVADGGIGFTEYEKIYEEANTEIKAYYNQETRVARKLINFIAKEAGVSKTTVEQALIREKFTGENPVTMWKTVFVEILGEQRGTDLFEALALAFSCGPESINHLERELSTDQNSFLARARNLF